MDFGKLITAIKNRESQELDHLYTETFEILCSYLRTTMRASLPDAEDCAQHALMMTVERIQKNAIRDPGRIYSYLLQSAKNRYLRVQYENKRSNYQDDMEAFIPIDEQLDLLTTGEEQEALEDCLRKLPDNSRVFINYWLEYPDAQASDVADTFGISINNVWTKKHRIIKSLSDCIEENLKK